MFKKLSRDNIEEITRIMLNNLKKRLDAMEITINVTDKAVSHLADAGFDPVYGARPLRRAIQSQVEDLISDEMLSGNVKEGQSVTVDCIDGKLVVTESRKRGE